MKKETRINLAIAILVLTLFQLKLYAQCYSTGWQSATSFSTDNSIGVYDFSNVSNVQSSDNSRASASSLISLLSGNTYYLKAAGFNFSIPSYASVCGITVEIESRATGLILTAAVRDNDIRLIKNGSITGTNHALAGDWGSTDAVHSYGNNADLWGTTLLPADVNASNFGIAVSARLIALVAALPSADIDCIRMKVDYNPILPLTLSFFKGDRNKNKISLEWEMAEEEFGSVTRLQRKSDPGAWSTIGEFVSTGNSINTFYKQTDTVNIFADYQYRLQLTQPSGIITFSEVRFFPAIEQLQISVIPNPATDHITVNAIYVFVLDRWGRQVYTPTNRSGSNTHVLVNGLAAGIYYVGNGKEMKAFIKQ
jgi:hypothetical protein